MRIEPYRHLLHNSLSPPPFGNKELVLMIHKMAANELMPVAQVHAVVLAYSEALLLVRANDVLGEVAEQPPVVQLLLPGLHQVIVGSAVEPQREQAQQRLLREQENSARREHALHLQEDALHVHELAECLECEHEAQRAV